MADNTRLPIEQIKVGDYVLSLEEKEQVKKVIQKECSKLLVITTNTGRTITITPNQKFMINGIPRTKAQDIEIEDLIICFENNDVFAETITNIAEVFPIDKRVYNFNLGENHNFSANGFLCLDFISQKSI